MHRYYHGSDDVQEVLFFAKREAAGFQYFARPHDQARQASILKLSLRGFFFVMPAKAGIQFAG
jgi:hypothetical protein